MGFLDWNNEITPRCKQIVIPRQNLYNQYVIDVYKFEVKFTNSSGETKQRVPCLQGESNMKQRGEIKQLEENTGVFSAHPIHDIAKICSCKYPILLIFS